MDFGNSSKPVMTVPPVVVKAENDSNTDSEKLRSGCSSKMKGTAPNPPNTIQNKTTIKKPSRARSSL